VYIKQRPDVPELAKLMGDAEMDYLYSPEKYPGVQKHYVLDIDNTELAQEVIAVIEPLTPLPKPRKKKSSGKSGKLRFD
jgi:hypothetical protein